MNGKANKLQILSFVGCVVIMLPVFLCGCGESEKDRRAREDKEAMEAMEARKAREYREYIGQAVLYNKGGQYENVIAVCKKAIAIKPDYAEAYYGMGHAYCDLKKYPEAIAAWKKAFALEPTGDMADYARDRMDRIENRD